MKVGVNMKRPIDYAIKSCETMMRKFEAAKLPPEGRFHYHQGVFLSGVHKTYELCQDERYFQYIKDWLDSLITADGEVLGIDGLQMDDIQPGILLYPMIKRYDDPRYEKALKFLVGMFDDYPRNVTGGLWHKEWHPNQMWLDGLYMGGPILAEYGQKYNSPETIDFVVEQVELMRKYTRDEESGLWYHAWDESRKEGWSRPDCGRSSEFWGRSIGWVPVAILEDMDFIDKDNPGYETLSRIVVDLIKSICKYQSAEGRWYQVVDKGNQEGNWLETSCSCLFVAAICKAVRIGILDQSYLEQARLGFEGVVNSLIMDGDDLVVNNVCVGTGVGDYQFYCDRPTCENDLHGVGAFLIMCAESEQVL